MEEEHSKSRSKRQLHANYLVLKEVEVLRLDLQTKAEY
jgi:hypothetical protein